jgi:hypothetical protein
MSAPANGFQFDRANARLNINYGGDPSVYVDAGGMTVPSGEILTIAGSLVDAAGSPIVRNLRTRSTIAVVNAGATLLAAVTGYKYRIISATAISVGGAAAAVTTVDILGTQTTSSVKLVAYAQASLTQSAVLKDGGTGAAVLANGASYVACDAATAITIGITGSATTTATHIDTNISYVLEAA